ncbi:hypothetical protein G6F59_017748 [Rhizopus arrhizus]|nr:hypothetical protein G6F59_017748 [Rhizopus arrhizus]
MDDPRYAQLLDLIDEALKSDMAVVLVADLTRHPSLGDALALTNDLQPQLPDQFTAEGHQDAPSVQFVRGAYPAARQVSADRRRRLQAECVAG